MSENYNNFESQMEKHWSFSFENLKPEEEVYSVFDDYLL